MPLEPFELPATAGFDYEPNLLGYYNSVPSSSIYGSAYDPTRSMYYAYATSPPPQAQSPPPSKSNADRVVENIREGFHHSSFKSGQAVAGAGDLICDNGKLIAISTFSGHYVPPVWALNQALLFLHRRGYDLMGVTAEWHDATKVADPANPKRGEGYAAFVIDQQYRSQLETDREGKFRAKLAEAAERRAASGGTRGRANAFSFYDPGTTGSAREMKPGHEGENQKSRTAGDKIRYLLAHELRPLEVRVVANKLYHGPDEKLLDTKPNFPILFGCTLAPPQTMKFRFIYVLTLDDKFYVAEPHKEMRYRSDPIAMFRQLIDANWTRG
jgi:hypothetical protein